MGCHAAGSDCETSFIHRVIGCFSSIIDMEMKEKNHKESKIDIKGMRCKSCVDLIESRIKLLKGIEGIKVSLAENKAFVKFDPNKISLDRIESEIKALGYSVGNCKQSKLKSKNILQGIAYGVFPHIGCIAFIIGSVLGVTVLMEVFKPALMNPYFFHILVLISLLFATLSSVLYLRKNSLLSLGGTKRKWKYLVSMYGSTIGINLLLFMIIFPLLANVSISPPITGAVMGAVSNENFDISSIRLQVDIPCPGHAPLISEELKSIDGIAGIQFGFPNIFDVKYYSSKTSKDAILSLEVFKTYRASVLEESAAQQSYQVNSQPDNIVESCCGGSSCGRSGGGCGCSGRGSK